MAEPKRPMDGPKERVLKGDTRPVQTPNSEGAALRTNRQLQKPKTIYLSHQTRGATWT